MKSKYTAAILAAIIGIMGMTGTAQAVNVNPDGLGQVLIYPYYTVNGGNVTLISLTNTTGHAKAVKVRFLEGENSREVLDFNLYLSAKDMWVAAVFDNDGVPTLEVADTSCTTPYLYDNDGNNDGVRDGFQPFLTYALTDGGSTDISRATEGHFEVIEMGVVINDTEDSADAITHVDGVPADCDQLQDAWTDPNVNVLNDEGYWLKDATVDMLPPSGGLFGDTAIINIESGAMYTYSATAINGWADSLYTTGNTPIHSVPGTELPSLNSGNIKEGVVFLDDGTVLTSGNFSRGVDAISFVLTRNALMGGYNTENNIGAGTEWVVTFPTKNFYVDPARNGGSEVPIVPFTSVRDIEDDIPSACEVVLLDSIWNREEETVTTSSGGPRPPIVSPPLPIQPTPIVPFELCYETSVVRFGETFFGNETEILGSRNFHNVDSESLEFYTGWLRIEFDDYGYDADADGVLSVEESALSRDSFGGIEGLPVVGFSVERYVNGYTGTEKNVKSTYGGLYDHKYSRKVSNNQ